MVNSLYYYESQNLFPLYWSKDNASAWTNAVLNIWPEIQKKYGNTNVTIKMDIHHQENYSPMEITDHIHFGGKLNVNMTGEINVFNTNTSENEVCLRFSANPECNATLTMHDLVFFPNITEVDIHNF